MKRFLKSISPLVALVVFSLASWALYEELRNYHWREFRDSLREIPLSRVGWAALLTCLDYTILIGNDWVASRIVGRRVPLAKLAAGSFTGYAASHNLGAAFGGAAVRYRFYSSWGASPSEIAVWIAMLAWSFALGTAVVGGASCLAHSTMPPEGFPFPMVNARWLGAATLALPGCYVAACALCRSPLRFRRREIRLPPPGLAAAQVIVGSADICCAAGILYVLLPPEATIGYPTFIAVYLLAIVATVCSHIPAGVSIFDLMMLKLLNRIDPHDILAALLVYRAVFYLLPLAVGLALFAFHELRRPLAPRAEPRSGGA
ncbi:MAG TPA: hypothetical protein VG826_22420 [Pirellulales bacterium]|nr:hypothetical protein [Pirellulales bacterium]